MKQKTIWQSETNFLRYEYLIEIQFCAKCIQIQIQIEIQIEIFQWLVLNLFTHKLPIKG